jgi:hypothetical protein
MGKNYSQGDIDGIMAEIATLESERASDLATYLGTKARHGGEWSGRVAVARRVQAGLASQPPDNLCSQEICTAWRTALNRVSAITNG